MPRAIVPLAAACLIATHLHAQSPWTATSLTAPNQTSRAFGVSNGVVAGQISGATLWRGSTLTAADLSPPGSARSLLYGTDGLQHVGVVGFNTTTVGPNLPALWSGTSASYVNLLPAGAINGIAYSVHGGQQAGYVFGNNGINRAAALWTGSASSFVNLSPGFNATAYSTYAGQQVGSADDASSLPNAVFWNGTAASMVNLHPGGSYILSAAYGTDGQQQVGTVSQNVGGEAFAALWSGTAQSFVKLSSSSNSAALAVFGGYQVGYVGAKPVLWSGSAASMEDLSLSLPAGQSWGRGEATGVWTDASTIYVSGWVDNQSNFNFPVAFLWTRPIPTPSSLATLTLATLLTTRRRR